MSGFLWNIRGLNKTSRHSTVRSWILGGSFRFGCLLETKVKESKIFSVQAKIGLNWSLLANYEHHANGRIWVLWRNDVCVTPVFKSSQLITCLIELGGGISAFYCSFVYASNLEEQRRDLWRDLVDHSLSPLFQRHPWWIGGDFNEVLCVDDHSTTMPVERFGGMRAFQNMVRRCELTEMATQGPKYTWCNRRQEGLIFKKLDRALINEEWNNTFMSSYVLFESGGCSDHLRGRFYLSNTQERRRKPFKFANVLTKYPDFSALVRDHWINQETLFVSTSAIYRFTKYLKQLKVGLRELGRSKLHNISEKVSAAYNDLCSKQRDSFLNPSPVLLAAEIEASKYWEDLSLIEEGFLKQRSKIHWLGVGDKNNRFFHNAVRERLKQNMINELVDRNGVRIYASTSIKNEAEYHFKHFLNDTPRSYAGISSEELNNLVEFPCSTEDGAKLISAVSDEEIRDVVFNLPRNKAPGPDGFTVEFFVTAWEFIGTDFITAIRSFFEKGFLPKGVNSTILALVRKKDDAIKMKDFRPISLCNVFYKVISRILANRLKVLLPRMIALNQSAFVPKRLLMENVLLATEIVKDYHKDNISPRCAMKIDISKAFDSVQWPFLLMVLRIMNLPEEFVRWIELCITTPSFSVQVNGELAGYFNSSRGLRQGCSLSPYLFVICMNVLSTMLDRGAKDRLFGYHPRCKNIGLTHLCFADDLLIFAEARCSSIVGVVAILDKFSRISGLSANIEKSSLFMAGLTTQERTDLQSAYPFAEGLLPVRYLGLPLLPKRIAQEDYAVLVERIRTKLCSWKGRFLSYAGRVQLVKIVVHGIINFWQSCFYLPAECIKELESLCSSFIWHGPELQSSSAKIAWETVCLPKDEGGLGLRKLKDVNRVSSLKLIWRLVSRKNSLWAGWVSSYILKGRSFWEAKNSTLGCWIYKKMRKLRGMARNLHKVEIRSGHGTSFWFDVWSDLGCLIDIVGPRGAIDMGISLTATVADAKALRRRRRYRSEVYRQIEEQIQFFSDREGEDIHLWQRRVNTYHDEFSTAHTWNLIRQQHIRVGWSRLVWFPQATPKFAFIFWLACWNRLSTMDQVIIWNASVNASCVLCGAAMESRDHLFFVCPYSCSVWYSTIGNLMGSSPPEEWDQIADYIHISRQDRAVKFLIKYAFQAVVYAIWTERNRRRHGHISQDKEVLKKLIDKGIRNKISSMREQGIAWINGGLQIWFSR